MVQQSLQSALTAPLRERAERLLSAIEKHKDISKVDIQALVHELQVHQVELEVQNEELRQAQLTLADTRDQYRELYDEAPVAYLSLNQQGIVLKANLKTSELLGNTRNNIIGSDLAEYILPSSQNDYFLHQQRIFSSEQKLVVELAIKTQPRKVVRMESVCKTLATAGASQSHTVLIDITGEKRLAQSLQELNQNLEQKVKQRTREINARKDELVAILGAATDAIITINDHGIIETVNRAAGPMFGYAENELIGSNVSLLMPAPHSHAHDDYIKNYFDSGISHILGRTTELLGKRKDNTLFPISLSVNRIDGSRRFTGIIRDVTERIQLENELLQCSELERNRISRELHDNISQSLIGIAMRARSRSALEDKSASQIAARLIDFSHELEKTAREVNAVASDLAALAIQDNRLEHYFATLVATCSQDSNITITLDWQEQLEIDDQRTGTQLYRITQEALQNAIKHAKATNIAVKIFKSNNTITLTIADNGVGSIPEKLMRGRIAGLSGFGINNMKYRAHVIAATLAIESDERGTTVSCVLPA